MTMNLADYVNLVVETGQMNQELVKELMNGRFMDNHVLVNN